MQLLSLVRILTRNLAAGETQAEHTILSATVRPGKLIPALGYLWHCFEFPLPDQRLIAVLQNIHSWSAKPDSY